MKAKDRIGDALRTHPEIGERTARFLAGELPGGASVNETQTAIRLPDNLLKRADALVSSFEADPTLRAFGRVTRSAVLRLAIERGLTALEGEAKKKGRG